MAVLIELSGNKNNDNNLTNKFIIFVTTANQFVAIELMPS